MDGRSSLGPEAAADAGSQRAALREEARRWHLRVDPDEAYQRCARLEERARSAARSAATARSRAAAREAAAQAELERTKVELDRAVREAARARRQLAGVRRSASWRLGRLVLAPGLAARRAWRVLRAAPRREETVDVTPPEVPGETSTDDLLARLADGPTPAALRDAVARLWARHGEIRRPAQLLRSMEGLVPDGDEVLKSLDRKVLAAADVQDHGFEIPPRSRTPLYRPRRRRVMYCVDATREFRTNGYTTRTQGVVAGVQAHGWDVVVVARTGFPWERGYRGPKVRTERRPDGTVYVHCPLPGLDPGLRERVVVTTDAFVREARRQRPEVIHAASNHLTALPALLAARVLGVPFVYEVRGLWELTAAANQEGWEDSERYAQEVGLEALVCREADAVVAITDQVKDELVARGAAPDRVWVAPNGVDTDTIAPTPKDKEYAALEGIDLDKVCLGYAGSMVDYEGLDILVDAVATLVAAGSGVQLVLAGDGRCAGALRQQVDELGIGDAVRFLGALPEHDMPRLLSLFDVVVCPRRSQRVTELVSPLKPLEAFAAGCAVVMSDVAPQRDLAGTDSPRALLFPPGDAGRLAATLDRLVADPDLRSALGASGRRYVVDERRWTAVAVPLVEAYTAAADHHARVSAAARPLSQVRVGVVADEFTSQSLAGTAATVALRRDGWRQQVGGLDAVFVESAWQGGGGQWHRGVGYYSDAEFADLRALVGACRDAGVPTVFFNKEDPVHTARFERAALLCDVIVTVDADLVPRYLHGSAGRARWVGSLSFWANPAVHHPLRAGSGTEGTVAYAGTFYGDRYPDRSRVLEALLDTAARDGLTIYDRQASDPDSPYRFPPGLQPYVRGAVPYDEVVQTYKSHLAHISVNSVEKSPTMFARRVVEIAASGGVVVSGPGRGVDEVFGPAIPVVDPDELSDWLCYWRDHDDARLAEAWSQIRAVLPGHTAHAALGLVLRAAGIAMDVPGYDTYGLWVPRTTDEVCAAVLAQSLPPSVVYTSCDDQQRTRLRAAGIDVEDAGAWADGPRPDWLGLADDCAEWGHHHFENLLLAAQWPGSWERLVPTSRCTGRLELAQEDGGPPGERGLVRSTAVVTDVREALVEPRRFLRMAVGVEGAAGQESLDGPDDRSALGEQQRLVVSAT